MCQNCQCQKKSSEQPTEEQSDNLSLKLSQLEERVSLLAKACDNHAEILEQLQVRYVVEHVKNLQMMEDIQKNQLVLKDSSIDIAYYNERAIKAVEAQYAPKEDIDLDVPVRHQGVPLQVHEDDPYVSQFGGDYEPGKDDSVGGAIQ